MDLLSLSALPRSSSTSFLFCSWKSCSCFSNSCPSCSISVLHLTICERKPKSAWGYHYVKHQPTRRNNKSQPQRREHRALIFSNSSVVGSLTSHIELFKHRSSGDYPRCFLDLGNLIITIPKFSGSKREWRARQFLTRSFVCYSLRKKVAISLHKKI